MKIYMVQDGYFDRGFYAKEYLFPSYFQAKTWMEKEIRKSEERNKEISYSPVKPKYNAAGIDIADYFDETRIQNAKYLGAYVITTKGYGSGGFSLFEIETETD